VVRLAVSIAAHSPLMGAVQEDFAAAIAQADIRPPAFPVIANISAQPLTDVDAIRQELVGQLQNSVQWTKSMQYLIGEGHETFTEFGPGKVLAGLMKRVDRRFRRMPAVVSWEDVLAVADKLG
jgi:[acyl-carrier-protein] S-malonyltransferase